MRALVRSEAAGGRPLVSLLSAAAVVFAVSAGARAETYQATGAKVGEVTPTSVVVWVRLTQNPSRDPGDGSCPGAAGRVRVRYGLAADLSDAVATDWVDVDSTTDYAHQFELEGLAPGTAYHFSTETSGPGGVPAHDPLAGSFRTAPLRGRYEDVTFTVVTGQQYEHLDLATGYKIYGSMLTLVPRFIVPTGDTVYYDKLPDFADTAALARWKWHRMYSLESLLQLHLRVPGYWEKDDHDTLKDDCWPGQTSGDLTFAEGQAVFLEQVPMGAVTYRSFRWGQGLEVWLFEGRDFRSANTDPDGPAKTIWGEAQKQWWKDTVLASDADWRVLVSPTPIIGPDRPAKTDNHANASWQTEGDEIRNWMHDNVPENTFIVCGDRHWQYHSKHPELGLDEFSCGPASDEHAGGFPGADPTYHQFYRMAGGFLSVAASRAADESSIAFRFHDVDGQVLYEYTRSKAAAPDTDGDGLTDGDEAARGTDPSDPDSDDDGLGDGMEVCLGTDPTSTDSDGDGMPDGWEAANGLDPKVDDASADSDGDGASNYEEFLAKTDPGDPGSVPGGAGGDGTSCAAGGRAGAGPVTFALVSLWLATMLSRRRAAP